MGPEEVTFPAGPMPMRVAKEPTEIAARGALGSLWAVEVELEVQISYLAARKRFSKTLPLLS